jgi:hypothetical protein
MHQQGKHMSTDSYLEYHRQLLASLLKALEQQPPFNAESLSEQNAEFLHKVKALSDDPNASDEGQHLGQQVIATIVARYPHITPMVPRDLFWFFGGDCLHYLGEEEISLFQQLDESYHSLEAEQSDQADYGKLRAGFTAQLSQQLN